MTQVQTFLFQGSNLLYILSIIHTTLTFISLLSDSVIYITSPGQVEPPTGDYLGDLTNELPPGRYIETFIGGGARNYSYRLDNGDEICHVRGFTLNY